MRADFGQSKRILPGAPRVFWAFVGVCLLFPVSCVWAFTLTNDQSLNGSADLVGDAEVITNQAGPVWHWSDIDGGGDTNGPGDDASDNLVLNNYRVTTTDGTTITMDLRNSNGKGALSGTNTLAISTLRASGHAGDVTILNVGDVDIGGIDTRASGVNSSCGVITIGANTDGQRAGRVRVDYLYTYATTTDRLSEDVNVYSSSNVLIQTSEGVPGDIWTYYSRPYWAVNGTPAGSIEILHDGLFVADELRTTGSSDNWAGGGDVTLNGDIKEDGASGALTLRQLYTAYLGGTVFGNHAGDIVVLGYTGVTITNIDSANHSSGNYRAGHCSITNISGDINIHGTIDLNGAVSAAYDADLTLEATGTITLASLDMDAVGDATFSAGTSNSYITQLSNVDTANPGNNGLDAAAGQHVMYAFKSGQTNDYLGGLTYTLPSSGKLCPDRWWIGISEATNVTSGSAHMNGILYGGPPSGVPVAVKLYYGFTDAQTSTGSWDNVVLISSDMSAGAFSTNIVTLDSDKVYYYRVWFTNSLGSTGWSENVESFITGGVTVQAIDDTAHEEDRAPGVFRISRPAGATNADLVVNFTLSGTATEGADYATIGTNVTITTGNSNVLVTVTPYDDPISGENNETVRLDLAGGSYSIASPSNATVTIVNSIRTWRYKMKVQFAGYDRSYPLTNFPWLVMFGDHLTDFSYSTFVSSTGGDLRFVNSNVTEALNFEIEEWDTSTNSYVWVQVPLIDSTNDYIWAYWGHTIETNLPVASTNGSTWDSTFVGVWHLNRTNGVEDLRDSTASRYDGTDNGTDNQPGKIAYGQHFVDSQTDDIVFDTLPSSTILTGSATPFSISTWFNADSIDAGDNQDRLVTVYDGTPSSALILGVGGSDEVQLYHDDGSGGVLSSTSSVSVGTWHYAAATYDGTTFRILVDGQPDSTVNDGLNAGSSYDVRIGSYDGSLSCFDGYIDEVRISNIKRSTNWVWACYMGVVSNSAFTTYTVSSTQPPPSVFVIR